MLHLGVMVQSPRYRLNSADQPQDHVSRCGVNNNNNNNNNNNSNNNNNGSS